MAFRASSARIVEQENSYDMMENRIYRECTLPTLVKPGRVGELRVVARQRWEDRIRSIMSD